MEARAKSDQYPDGFPDIDEPAWLDQKLYENDPECHPVQGCRPEAGTDGLWTKDLAHMNDVEPLPSSMADEYLLFEAKDVLVSP